MMRDIQFEAEDVQSQDAPDYRGKVGDTILSKYRQIAECEVRKILASTTKTISPPIEIEQVVNASADNVFRDLCNGNLNRMISITLSIRDAIREILHPRGITPPRKEPYNAPTLREQIKRNADLNVARETTASNESLKKHVVQLAKEVLIARFPTEMFNVEGSEFLSDQQINDLVDNFLLWAIQYGTKDGCDERLFSDHQLLIVYFVLFHGSDAKAIEEKMKYFEEKDGVEYGLTSEEVERLYKETCQTFNENADMLLAKFLSQASFNDAEDKKVIPNYKRLWEDRKTVMEKYGKYVKRKQVNIAGVLQREERRNLDIPATQYDYCLAEINIIRAQRGDISARNKVAISMLRFTGKTAHTGRGMYMTNKYGTMSDDSMELENQLRADLVTKIVKIDPRRGTATAFFTKPFNSAINNFIWESAVTHKTSRVSRAMRHIKEHSPRSIEELCTIFSLPKNVIEAVLAMDPTEIQRAIIDRNRFTPAKIKKIRDMHKGLSDQAISHIYGIPMLMLSRIRQDLHIERNGTVPVTDGMDLEKHITHVADGVKTDFQHQLIEKALACLSPSDAEFLKERFLDEKTLPEMAQKRGLDKQRIEQLEKSLLCRLSQLAEQPLSDNEQDISRNIKLHHIVIVQDKDALEKWLDSNRDLHPDAPRWFRVYLGLDTVNGYRRTSTKPLYRILFSDDEQGVVSLRDFRRIISTMSERLKTALSRRKYPSDSQCFVIGINQGAGCHEAAKLLEKAAHLF